MTVALIAAATVKWFYTYRHVASRLKSSKVARSLIIYEELNRNVNGGRALIGLVHQNEETVQ